MRKSWFWLLFSAVVSWSWYEQPTLISPGDIQPDAHVSRYGR